MTATIDIRVGRRQTNARLPGNCIHSLAHRAYFAKRGFGSP